MIREAWSKIATSTKNPSSGGARRVVRGNSYVSRKALPGGGLFVTHHNNGRVRINKNITYENIFDNLVNFITDNRLPRNIPDINRKSQRCWSGNGRGYPDHYRSNMRIGLSRQRKESIIIKPKESHLRRSLLAFFGGLFGISALLAFWYLANAMGRFGNPFAATLWGYFLFFLIYAGAIEEGIKFLLIKRNIGRFPYGFLLGLGFGIGETMLRYPFSEFGPAPERRWEAVLLHVITAGILCYFVKKNKPVLGLAMAIAIHTGFDVFIQWAVG